MDQDATWYGDRPRPRWLCLRWGPSHTLQKWGTSPKFSAHIYCGKMAGLVKMPLGTEVGSAQVTLCQMGTQFPPKGAKPPQFLAHVRCGQTAGWIKMPFGTEVGLGPGDCVLDGDPAPPKRRGHSPQFSAHVYCGQTAGCIMIPLGMEVGHGQGDIVLGVCPAPPPQMGYSPKIFCPCLLWPNGRPSQLLLSSCLFYSVLAARSVTIWRQMAFDAPNCFEAVASRTSFTYWMARFVLVWSYVLFFWMWKLMQLTNSLLSDHSLFFTARRIYVSVVLGVVILSVCLSHACFVTNPKNLPAIFLYHMKGQSL